MPIHREGVIPLFAEYLAVRPQTAEPALFLAVYGKRLGASLIGVDPHGHF